MNNTFEIYSVYSYQDNEDLKNALRAPGGVHVYCNNPGEEFESFIVSTKPLTPRIVSRIFYAEELGIALECALADLKCGRDVADVWREHGVSAQRLTREAKKAGITLPRNWFAKAYAENKRREAAGLCVDCGEPLAAGK